MSENPLNEANPLQLVTAPSGLRLGGNILPPISDTEDSLVDLIFARAAIRSGQKPSLEELFLLAGMEEVLGEAKQADNDAFIEFLNEEDILDQMLDYAANFNQPFNPTAMKAEGKTDEQELIQLRIGCIRTSCELLALDGTELCIYTEENRKKILHFLFSFIVKEDNGEYSEERDGNMPPQISAIAQVFIVKHPEIVIEYLIETDPTVFVASFIEKLGQSEVLNLLLSIVWLLSPSPSKASSQTTELSILGAESFNEWLATGDFVPKIIEVLSNPKTQELASSVSEIIQELSSVSMRHFSRKLEPPQILQQLIREESLNSLIPPLLNAQDDQVFSAGVAIILEFLKYEAIVQKARNKPKEQGTNPPLLFRLISQHLDKLINRLKPKDKGERFGFMRLRVLGFFGRFVAQAIANSECNFVLNALNELNFWNVLLDIFFNYLWNNFAHNVIERIVCSALASEHKDLKLLILRDCRLVDRIVEANKLNEEETKTRGTRRGNMGAIVNISIALQKSITRQPPEVSRYLSEHSGWQEFSNGPLAQARRIQECYDGPSISAPKFTEEEGGARVGRGRGGRGGSLDGLREGGIIQTLRGRGRGVSSSSAEASASTGTASIIQALGGRGRGRGEGATTTTTTTTTTAAGEGRGRGRGGRGGRGSTTSGSSVF